MLALGYNLIGHRGTACLLKALMRNEVGTKNDLDRERVLPTTSSQTVNILDLEHDGENYRWIF